MPEHNDPSTTVCDKCARVSPKVYWDLDYTEILCIVCLCIQIFKRMRKKQKIRFLRELRKETNGS